MKKSPCPAYELKNSFEITIPTLTWIRRALSEYDLRLADLTPEIAGENAGLQGFHEDPADQIIVATSRVLGMPVVTADQMFIQFRGGRPSGRRAGGGPMTGL